MRAFSLFFTNSMAAVILAGATLGCGGSSSSTPTAGAPAVTSAISGGGQASVTSPSPAAAAALPSDPIAKVVYEFLDAVRRGDTQAASVRLTPLALQKTSEMDFVFAPPGSPTARFQVGAVQKVEEDKAVVESVWTDLDADGKPQDEPTVWAVRLVEGGWRVSGMVANLGENQQPLVIDFENPATMAPEQPVDPARVVDGQTTPAGEQPTQEVARNPFDAASQR